MGKLLYMHEDGMITELTIGDGFIVDGDTLRIIDVCVINSILNSFKLNDMLIS